VVPTFIAVNTTVYLGRTPRSEAETYQQCEKTKTYCLRLREYLENGFRICARNLCVVTTILIGVTTQNVKILNKPFVLCNAKAACFCEVNTKFLNTT